MILTEERHILNADQFAAGMDAASRGVVRIVLSTAGVTQSLATGWLVTDTLVVVPAFAATSATLRPSARSATISAARAISSGPYARHPAAVRTGVSSPRSS